MTITEVGIGIENLAPVADLGVPVGGDTWSDAAACRTVPGASDLFFSEEVPDIIAAKRICAECPVIAPCLEEALERREPCGVWGGQLFENGQIIHRKRRRGRPPKVARPEDQLLEVPIPEHLQKLIA
jgi:WhiB family redox-sensing transcriptional regulator